VKNSWQLQEAKNQLSRIVAAARTRRPQTITVHGKDAVVVLSTEAYRKLRKPMGTLVEFFQRSPLRGVDLKIKRSTDTGRKPVKF
jgi:prevent-host-death family protein